MSMDQTPRKDLVLVPAAVCRATRTTKGQALRARAGRFARWVEHDLGACAGRRGREFRDALTDGWPVATPWIKILAFGVLAALLYPALALLVHLITGASDATARIVLHTHHTGIAATVLGPLKTYLAAHCTGLPVTADTAGSLWESAGLSIWVLAAFGSTIGRLLWLGFGAATAAMVWSTSPDPGRPVATAITVILWGAASLVALAGLRLRPTLIVNADPIVQTSAPTPPRVPGHGPSPTP